MIAIYMKRLTINRTSRTLNSTHIAGKPLERGFDTPPMIPAASTLFKREVHRGIRPRRSGIDTPEFSNLL